KYLKRHRELQAFLNQHPGIREEMKENPSYFMHRENRLEANETDRINLDRDSSRPDRDANKQQLAQIDHFLDKHKDIAKQLQTNPSLVNDEKYLKHHKDLQEVLTTNPEAREELSKNPSYFTRREARLERHDSSHRVKSPDPDKPET